MPNKGPQTLINIPIKLFLSEPFTSATPVECNEDLCNKGKMGNKNKGFTTYTFVVQSQHGDLNPDWPRQEFFTVYRPMNRENESLPVVFTLQAYARNRLNYQYANFQKVNCNEQTREKCDENKAAQKYGYARILLSSPSGGWTKPSKFIL